MVKNLCFIALAILFFSAPAFAKGSPSLQELQKKCTNDFGQLFWEEANSKKCKSLLQDACPQGQMVSSSEDGLECIVPTLECLAGQVVLADSTGQRCVSPTSACSGSQVLQALPSGKGDIVYECGEANSRSAPVRRIDSKTRLPSTKK